MPEQCKSEQKRLKKSNTSHILFTSVQVDLGSFIDCENFSSKERLLRVTAYILRFVKLLKQGSACSNSSTHITPEEMQQAETYWLRESQASLESKPLFKTWQQRFGSFHDNSGIWRCGGRLSNADLPFATKHPALLDSQHHLFTLIALEAHARVQHNRVCETLTELKAEY